VGSSEVGQRLRERRVAGMVSFIFNGAAVTGYAWTDGEGND
jgi:hypothetical protein